MPKTPRHGRRKCTCSWCQRGRLHAATGREMSAQEAIDAFYDWRSHSAYDARYPWHCCEGCGT